MEKTYDTKNKANRPPAVNVKEDFSIEVLEKRKQLLPRLEEERKKGNIAYLKSDKLIVKRPTDNTRDKRKREDSGSPNALNQKKINAKENKRKRNFNTINFQKCPKRNYKTKYSQLR